MSFSGGWSRHGTVLNHKQEGADFVRLRLLGPLAAWPPSRVGAGSLRLLTEARGRSSGSLSWPVPALPGGGPAVGAGKRGCREPRLQPSSARARASETLGLPRQTAPTPQRPRGHCGYAQLSYTWRGVVGGGLVHAVCRALTPGPRCPGRPSGL